MKQGRTDPHLPAIDGLRAVSIVAVMAFHFSLGLQGGFLGVDLFFTISGFVITRGLLTSASGAVPTGQLLRAFYRRRIWRLWPALSMLLFVVAGVAIVVAPSYWEDSSVTLRNTVAAVFASGNWFQVAVPDPADGGFRPLIHMWSLSIEEQFYLVLPLAVLSARRHASRVASGVGAAAIFAALVAAFLSPSARWSFFATPARIAPVGVGVLVAVLLQRTTAAQHARRVPSMLFGLCGLGCAAIFGVLTLFASWEQRWLWRGGYAALAIVYGLLVWSTAQSQDSWWGRLLSIGPLQWLGSRSYSIYLVHFPLAGILDRSGQLAPHSERAGLVVASLLIAELSYRLIESPLRGVGRLGYAGRSSAQSALQ